MIQYISLEISHNGYIVSANPTPTRLINNLIQE
jgi:filamentous hemagglutinin